MAGKFIMSGASNKVLEQSEKVFIMSGASNKVLEQSEKVFIVFEGGEGSGKSTQVKLLSKKLKRAGFKVLLTHEPGEKKLEVTKKIREILLNQKHKVTAKCELFLFLADRAQHTCELIKPALEAGKIVICDRFDASTFAYQHFGRGLDYNFIKKLNSYAKDNLEPDLYILLDVPAKVGLTRRFSESEKITRFEKEDLEFHKKVNQGFRKLAQANPKRWAIVDGSKSIPKIHQEVVNIIKKKLKFRI